MKLSQRAFFYLHYTFALFWRKYNGAKLLKNVGEILILQPCREHSRGTYSAKCHIKKLQKVLTKMLNLTSATNFSFYLIENGRRGHHGVRQEPADLASQGINFSNPSKVLFLKSSAFFMKSDSLFISSETVKLLCNTCLKNGC
jgi:hypothetical protein